MKKNIFFITFEGTDGVGKSTHIRLLSEWFQEKKLSVVQTREPGGGDTSEKIRQLLLDEKSEMADTTELLLYLAARSEHVETVIRPALKKGCVVLCDRFTDATVAYQGFARGMDLKTIGLLNRTATGGLSPDLTLWLDLSPKQGMERVLSRKGGKLDRLEKEGLQFQNRVRAGYQAISKKEPHRFFRIPVQSNIDDTQRLIRAVVEKKLRP